MKLKRLLAGVLSAAMLLSVGSTLAFADTVTGQVKGDSDTIVFDSVIYLSESAITAPEVTYTYTLSSTLTANTTYTDAQSNSTVIYPGVLVDSDSNSVTVTATAEFSATDLAVEDSTSGAVTVTEKISLDLSSIYFTKAGIYQYTLTESAPDVASGVAADSLQDQSVKTRYVYVTVENGTSGLEITEILMSEIEIATSTDVGEKSDSFIHSYGIAIVEDPDETDPDPDEPGTTSSSDVDFIVTDTAFGKMAEASKEFNFTVVVEGASTGSIYKVESETDDIAYIYVDEDGYVYEASAPTEGATAYTHDTEAYTFTLSDLYDTFTIYGVAEGVKFTVTIADPLADGYSFYSRDYDHDYVVADVTNYNSLNTWTTTEGTEDWTMEALIAAATNGVQGIDFATVKGEDDTPNSAVADDDLGITYSGGFPSTGVILEFAPFALMALAAGAVISLRAISAAKQRK